MGHIHVGMCIRIRLHIYRDFSFEHNSKCLNHLEYNHWVKIYYVVTMVFVIFIVQKLELTYRQIIFQINYLVVDYFLNLPNFIFNNSLEETGILVAI